MTTPLRRWAFPAFAAFMLVLPLLPVPDFWITQSNYIGLYALVALGLVLLTGVGGLTSFGQAAFVGIGAYASAYLATAQGTKTATIGPRSPPRPPPRVTPPSTTAATEARR